ncbi:MAG: toll/interleukin-1 receptor domain-containing protein, partial [Pseudomonadota bacterium]
MTNEKDQKEVFISYSTKNSELAQFLCNQLEGSGAACWISPRDIPSGQNWANSIVNGITDAKLTLLLVSEASLASEEVAKEIDLANGMRKTMLPVRIENVTLKGAFLYHLSNKQSVDALGDDKFTRFNSTTETVLALLNKKDVVSKDIVAGSISDQAKKLVHSLNQKHRQRLDKINAMFSCQEKEDHLVLFLPLRIGATGVDLILLFDSKNKTMEIYADAASNGDPIKCPFVKFIETHCTEEFPNLSKTKGAKRWRFVGLVPPTVLTTHLADLSSEKCFETFTDNVMAFSDKVIPKLFDWIEYALKVTKAINKLEDELKKVFPEDEGWRIGAPEGERLIGCNPHGRINIYKKEWQPTDDYKGRGWLSITLESWNSFVDNLFIGILKYEPWMTLQDLEGKLISECNSVLGESSPFLHGWPWYRHLEDDWKSSGIAQINLDLRWNDDQLDGFIRHCLDKFRELKKIEGLLGDICSKMPSMQRIDIGSIENVSKEQLGWWESSLYVYNRMERLANTVRENIQANFGSPGISVDFSYRGQWWTDILLKIKVENFDAAIRFRCGKNMMIT